MNLSTTIIGLLVMSIFIVPVLLLTRSGKRKAKQFERDFFSVVSRNKLLISEKSFWSDYAIGVDSSKNIIIYMDKSGPEMIDKIISISDVKDFYTFPGKKKGRKKILTIIKCREWDCILFSKIRQNPILR